MRQQIAVGNVIENHAMIEAWRANSWVAPSGEGAADAVSEAEPSPQAAGPGWGWRRQRGVVALPCHTSRHLMTLSPIPLSCLDRF